MDHQETVAALPCCKSNWHGFTLNTNNDCKERVCPLSKEHHDCSVDKRRLGLHFADVNRIATKSDTIRFTSDSDPLHFSTKVCVYTDHMHERMDNFVRALRALLREAVVVPSFRNLRKVF